MLRSNRSGRANSEVNSRLLPMKFESCKQSSDATREIASLIESMQLVTQESIRGIESRRQEIESATDRAANVEQSLQQICGASERDVCHLREIAASSNQQLKLAQDVVLAIEQISSIAKANRSGAESIGRTTKSLDKSTPPITSLIDRFRRNCSGKSKAEHEENANHRGPAVPVVMPMSTSVPTPVT